MEWIARDGSLLGHVSTSRVCVYTNADASAHTVLKDFGAGFEVQGLRELADGELLVSTAKAGETGKLWRSTDYPSLGSGASWTEVLATSVVDGSFSHVWGMHSYGEIVVASEYGPKTPPNCASKAYVSEDDGATWTEIYDGGQADNLHVHGIAYDRWWDRIWITQGDTGNIQTVYSDDWREATPTWTVAFTSKLLLSILPLDGAVCFTTDDAPAGIYRIRRTGYRIGDAMELVHTVNAAFINLGTQAYQRTEHTPGLFAFKVTDGQESVGVLVASMDGLTFHEVWRDDEDPYPGGLYRIVGPTDDGKMIGTASDPRFAAYTRLVIDTPTWAKN